MAIYNSHYLGHEITSPSTADVVSLDQIRDFLRIDADVCDNGLLELLRSAATDAVTNYLNRTLLSSTAVAYYSNFSTEMPLPQGKVTAITSVKYRDENNTLQTVSSSNYLLINHNEHGPYVWIDPDYSRPSMGDYPRKVEITYTTGYTAASTVPTPIVLAILNLCSDYYDDRSLMTGKITQTKLRFALNPYRIVEV